MDIIDIMLAKALSQPADVYKYAEQAAKAAKSAQDAADSADDAIASVEAAATDIDDKVAAATDFLTIAEQALEDAREAGVTKTMLDLKADKADTILDTTLSRGRRLNVDVGTGSIAFGNNAEASGNYSASFGNNNMASGTNAFAEGNDTTASGSNSHAEGSDTQATNTNTHAEGSGSQATNTAAHAEGTGTLASGQASHAEGGGTIASGHGSHAEGALTTASGLHSHAEGMGAVANALASHAGGSYNVSTSVYPIWTANTQYYVGDKVSQDNDGYYNYECITANADAVFRSSKWKPIPTNTENYVTIGNGTADNARSNAYALDWHGNGYYKGDVYVNANSDSSGGVKLTPIPAGGTAGQILAKNSNSNYDIVWIDSAGGGSGPVPPTPTEEKIGLDIDYQNGLFIRTELATNLEMGQDFDQFIMYGGRKRCNVLNDGTITAFYGDNNYREDGTNGQVMVYQPKFYYKRYIMKIDESAVQRETLLLSSKKLADFKLHPIFDAGDNQEYDYVLFSAYEGKVINNMLSSVAGEQPSSNMTIDEAEAYATARGSGWHIMNMAAVSANQMLEILEFGQLNGQTAIEDGIVRLSYTANVNSSAITGSTSELGNITGHATITISNNNGTEISNTEAGKRAINYRGIENPWGNLWNMIGGINIKGDGQSQGGAPYICTNYNYNSSTIGSNYEYIGFNLPSTYDWISNFGYANEKYDWVLMPIKCENANSLLPIGDNLWTVKNVSENKIVAVGGTYSYSTSAGPFYYACDSAARSSKKHNYGARLLFIPTKNSIYTQNITKWTATMGG